MRQCSGMSHERDKELAKVSRFVAERKAAPNDLAQEHEADNVGASLRVIRVRLARTPSAGEGMATYLVLMQQVDDVDRPCGLKPAGAVA